MSQANALRFAQFHVDATTLADIIKAAEGPHSAIDAASWGITDREWHRGLVAAAEHKRTGKHLKGCYEALTNSPRKVAS